MVFCQACCDVVTPLLFNQRLNARVDVAVFYMRTSLRGRGEWRLNAARRNAEALIAAQARGSHNAVREARRHTVEERAYDTARSAKSSCFTGESALRNTAAAAIPIGPGRRQ